MTTNRLTKAALVCVLGTLMLAGQVSPVHADTISVSPPRFELFGNPGDIVTESLKLRNDSTEDVVYRTDVLDFKPRGDEGAIDVEEKDQPTTTYSMYKWVNIEPSQFTVPAQSEKIVQLTIRIPKDAEPGGHYATVQVGTANSPQIVGSGAAVQTQLNSLILLRVSGQVNEKLSMEFFKTEDKFYQKGPIDFQLSTKNEGNVHLAPTGLITITDTFNRKIKEIPLKVANVLPGATRRAITTWEDKNMIGRFTATMVATYGESQNKPTITASTTFVVIPLYLVWIVLGVIVIIVLAITQRKQLKKLINRLTSD